MCVCAGCRLPHCWLQELPTAAGSATNAPTTNVWVSSLDVVAGLPDVPPQPCFTLFADSVNLDCSSSSRNATVGSVWLHGLSLLHQQHPEIRQLVAGVCVVPANASQRDVSAPGRHDNGWRVMADATSSWHRTMHVQEGSVLLVRPDGHVAWRHGPLRPPSASSVRQSGDSGLATSRSYQKQQQLVDNGGYAPCELGPGEVPQLDKEAVRLAADLLLRALQSVLCGLQ
jgi:hypothetical protein